MALTPGQVDHGTAKIYCGNASTMLLFKQALPHWLAYNISKGPPLLPVSAADAAAVVAAVSATAQNLAAQGGDLKSSAAHAVLGDAYLASGGVSSDAKDWLLGTITATWNAVRLLAWRQVKSILSAKYVSSM